MEISPRQISKRTAEPIDEWLQNEGYFRKHAPKDPTCLFRAVSEQVYLTQHDHIRVRKECVRYMRENIHLFQESITISVEDYLEQMACFTEWGGNNEIQAMSLLYKRDFVIFSGQKLTRITATNHGFNKFIYLCHTSQKQYESVYSRDYVSTAAFCQSIVYQTLYRNVFKMTDIDNTVHKMLHDRSPDIRHDKFFLKGNVEIRDQLKVELYKKLEDTYEDTEEPQSGVFGTTPFPYRVAKALDPNIYRNTDLDIWHELKREVRNAGWMRYNTDFQIGGKCLVQVDLKDECLDKANNNSVYETELKEVNSNEPKMATKTGKKDPLLYSGHIQEMSKNEGPVVVFIEELGEKRTVPYSALKPLAPRKNKQTTWNNNASKKNAHPDQNTKWKKSWGSSRKAKDHGQNSSLCNSSNMNFDQNNNNNVNRKDSNSSNNYMETGRKNESTTLSDKCRMHNFNTYQNYSVTSLSNAVPVENVQSSTSETGQRKNLSEIDEKRKIHENDINVNISPKKQQQQEQYSNTIAFPSGPYFMGSMESVSVDQNIQPVNLSVSKSLDINGSDLPFSDTNTLRFFYNLGLEYFHANQMWNCPPNEQTMSYYMSQGGLMPSQMINNDLNINNEGSSHVDGTQLSKHVTSRRKEDSVQRGKRSSSPQKMMQKNSERYSKSVQNLQSTGQEFSKNVSSFTKTASHHDATDRKDNYQVNGRDVPRNARNGLAPRFKKNIDGRNSNYTPQMSHMKQQDHHQRINHQRFNGKSKTDLAQQQNERNETEQTQILQQQMLTPNGNSVIYPIPFSQPSMYSQMTLCGGEAEMFPNPFYPANANIFPLQYSQPPDMNDSANVSAFPSQPYLGVENFTPACQMYPPYVFPQAPLYPGVAPTNIPENWYPVQPPPPPAPSPSPHFNMQYAAVPSSNNGSPSNLSQSSSIA